MKYKDIFAKSMAVITAVVFITESLGWAAPVNQPSAISHQLLANIYIPEQYASVGQVDGPTGEQGNGKSVVLIKDAHCVYEAQQNISRILDILIRDYKIDLVCVEGAVDKVDTSRLGSYADREARKKVAEKYLNNGLFTAGEALSIKNGANPGFTIYGVEDARLYWKDFQAFRDTVDGSRINSRLLELIDSIIFQLKKKLYPQELLGFDNEANEYKNGKILLTDWVKILSKEYGVRNKNEFKNFRLVVRAINLEEKMNFKKVETEKAVLIRRLEKGLVREDLKGLVKNSLLFKLGKISALDYYSYLEGIGNAEMGENLRRYVKLVKVQARIDEDELFRELDLTEEGIYKDLIPDETTGKIHQLDKDLDILKNILQLKADRGEILYYKENRANFTPDRFLDFIKIQAPLNRIPLPKEFNTPSFIEEVKKGISPSEEFYELALRRDEALVDNLLKRMDDAKKDKAILVCGGFHAEGIGRLLRDKGINLVTISPAITKAQEDSQKIYLSRMMDERINPVDILSQLGVGNIQPVILHDTALPKTIGDLLLKNPEMDLQRLCQRVGVGVKEFRKLTIGNLNRRLLEELKEEYASTDDDAYAGFLELVFTEYNETGPKEQIDLAALRGKRGSGEKSIREKGGRASIPWIKEKIGGFTPIVEEILFSLGPFWLMYLASLYSPILGAIGFVSLTILSRYIYVRAHLDKDKDLAFSVSLGNSIFLGLIFVWNIFYPIDLNYFIPFVITIPILWHSYKNSGLSRGLNTWLRVAVFISFVIIPFILPRQYMEPKITPKTRQVEVWIPSGEGYSIPMEGKDVVRQKVRTDEGRMPMESSLENLLFKWHEKRLKRKLTEKEEAKVRKMAREYKKQGKYNPTPEEIEDVCGKVGSSLVKAMEGLAWPELSREQMKIFIESLLEAESDNEHWIADDVKGVPVVKVIKSNYNAYGISQIKEIAVRELGKFIYDNLRIIKNPKHPDYDKAVRGLKILYLLLIEDDYSADGYERLDVNKMLKYFNGLPDEKGEKGKDLGRKDLSRLIKKSWDSWEYNIRVSSAIVYITYDYFIRNIGPYTGDYPIWRMVIGSYNWNYYDLIRTFKKDPYLWILQTSQLCVHTSRFEDRYSKLTGRSIADEPYWRIPPIIGKIVNEVYREVALGRFAEARLIINKLGWKLGKFSKYVEKKGLDIVKVKDLLGIINGGWRGCIGRTLKEILYKGIDAGGIIPVLQDLFGGFGKTYKYRVFFGPIIEEVLFRGIPIFISLLLNIFSPALSIAGILTFNIALSFLFYKLHPTGNRRAALFISIVNSFVVSSIFIMWISLLPINTIFSLASIVLLPLFVHIIRNMYSVILEEITNIRVYGKYNIRDPLHRLIGYWMLVQQFHRRYVKPPTYGEFSKRHGEIGGESSLMIAPDLLTSSKHSAELIYLAWEGYELKRFIDKVKERADILKRPIVVVENLSYGRIAIAPIRKLLEKEGITVWSARVGSSEAHDNPDILNPDLFTDEQLEYLIRENPVVIVVDGSNSLDPQVRDVFNRKEQRYPDGLQGYQNYFAWLTYVLSDKKLEMKELMERFNLMYPLGMRAGGKGIFYDEYDKLTGMIKKHSAGNLGPQYGAYYWTPSELKLKRSVSTSEAPEVEERTLMGIDSRYDLRESDLSGINGPALILVQSGIEDELVPAEIRKLAMGSQGGIKHSTCHFDDTGLIHPFSFILTPYGPRATSINRHFAEEVYPAVESLMDRRTKPSAEANYPFKMMLFDLDLTLSGIMEPIPLDVVENLVRILKEGVQIGIITLQGLDELKINVIEPLKSYCEKNNIGLGIFSNLHLFPSSGAEGYGFSTSGELLSPYYSIGYEDNKQHETILRLIKNLIEDYSGIEIVNRNQVIMLHNVPEERLSELISELIQEFNKNGIDMMVMERGRHTIEIKLPFINKGFARNYMLARFSDIKPEEILVAGDGLYPDGPDFEMRIPGARNFLVDNPLHTLVLLMATEGDSLERFPNTGIIPFRPRELGALGELIKDPGLRSLIQVSSGTHKAIGPTWSDEDNADFEEQCKGLLRGIEEETVPEVRDWIRDASVVANKMTNASGEDAVKDDRISIHIIPLSILQGLGIPRRPGAASASDMVYAAGRNGYYDENGNLVKDGRLHIYVTQKYWDEVLSRNELQLAETLDHEWQENILGKLHKEAAERARFFIKEGEMVSEYHRFVIGEISKDGANGILFLRRILKEKRRKSGDKSIRKYENNFRKYVMKCIKENTFSDRLEKGEGAEAKQGKTSNDVPLAGIPGWRDLLKEALEEGLIENAIKKMKGYRGREGALCDIDGVKRLVVIGDLHRNYSNLINILLKDGIWEDIRNGNAHLVILGDAIHPGSGDIKSPEAQEDSLKILILLMKLIDMCPENVHYVMGDHEFSHVDSRFGVEKEDVDGNYVAQNGLFEGFISNSYGEEFVGRIKEFLSELPFVGRVNKTIALTHAGASENLMSEEHLRMLDMENMLNLRLIIDIVFRLEGKRNVSRNEITWFLMTLGCKFLFTGHTVPYYENAEVCGFNVIKEGSIGHAYGEQIILDSQSNKPGYIDVDLEKSGFRKGLGCLVDSEGRPALKVLGRDVFEEVVDEIFGIFNKKGVNIKRKDVWEALVDASGLDIAPSIERIIGLLKDIPEINTGDLFAIAKEIAGPLGRIGYRGDGGMLLANILERILKRITVKIEEVQGQRERFFNTVRRLLIELGVTEAELSGELELIEMGLFLLEHEPLLDLTKVDKGYFDYFSLVCELAGIEPEPLKDIFSDAYMDYQNEKVMKRLKEMGVDVDGLSEGKLELEMKRKGLWKEHKGIDRIINMIENGFKGANVVETVDSLLSKAARRLMMYKKTVDNGMKGKINIDLDIEGDLVGLSEAADFNEVIVENPQQLNTYLSGTAVASEFGDYLIKRFGIQINDSRTVSIPEELFIEGTKGDKLTYSPGIVVILKKAPGLKVEIRAWPNNKERVSRIVDLIISENPELKERISARDEFRDAEDLLDNKNSKAVYVLSERQKGIGETLVQEIKENRLKVFCTSSMALYSVLIYGILHGSVENMFKDGFYTEEGKDVIRKLEIFGVSKRIIDRIIAENQPLIIITTEQLLRQYQIYRATIAISA